tara:strand:+ start:551 stop:964 length:414 start_codon:yes stop_codon:yes gene_type:complete
MLDKICTDLTTSKRLKELEIEIKTKFYWESDIYNQNYSVGCWYEKPQDNVGYFEYIPCFTLEQILEILPKEIEADFDEETQTYRSTYIFKLSTAETGYFMGYVNLISDNIYIDFRCIKDNLVTTAARLLIKLIEEKK